MSKPEWGIKRICKKCSAFFYDMCREPIVCPKCSSSFTASDFLSRYSKSTDKPDSRKESKRPYVDETSVILADDEHIAENDLMEEDAFPEEIDIIEHTDGEEER